MGGRVRYRRIYDDRAPDDGVRVLVDRVWPRGLRKDDSRWDEWVRDAAPSTELRRWYGHDPDKFLEFGNRYLAELREPPASEALHNLRELAGRGNLTLLTAARDLEHSQAAVLAGLLAELASPR